MNIIASCGRIAARFLNPIGSVTLFAIAATLSAVRPPFRLNSLCRQFLEIGFYSLPVVGLTTLFAGMVLALQSHTGFSRFDAGDAVPNIVILSITRELGPVLTGLMIAGRVGAAFAAELGSMRVTEQVDAMRTLNVSPLAWLVAPRLIAATLMLPVLVLIGDVIGVLGGFLVSVFRLDFDPVIYLNSSWNFIEGFDISSGLLKAAVFGFLVALMGCYHGLSCGTGARGVGIAVTRAVVSASILILIANYLVTEWLFG